MADAPPAELLRFIEAHVEAASPPFEVTRLTAGFSNITWRVNCAQRQLIVRQAPPSVAIKGAHDVEREYRFMQRLRAHWTRVPEVLALCLDDSVLGSRFFVMEFVAGRGIDALSAPDAPALAQACCHLVLTLAELHRIDPRAAALADKVEDVDFARRQVDNAIKRYRAAESRSIAPLEAVMAWLQAHPVATRRLAVTHNDYRFDNIIFAPNDSWAVRAVLDWEMATVGDPWMDLGMALAYWAEPGDDDESKRHALGPTLLPGALSRAQVCALYAKASGFETPHLSWYCALGLLRLIVILQQLQARAARGQSQDQRFASMAAWIDALALRAVRTIEERPLG